MFETNTLVEVVHITEHNKNFKGFSLKAAFFRLKKDRKRQE